MKAKIMALMLAVVLGTVGIAATAQAAAGAAGECTHPGGERLNTLGEKRHYYNPYCHVIIYTVQYKCDVCHQLFINDVYEYEPHDYEQIYCDDGRVFTYCIGCDDSYYY